MRQAIPIANVMRRNKSVHDIVRDDENSLVTFAIEHIILSMTKELNLVEWL